MFSNLSHSQTSEAVVVDAVKDEPGKDKVYVAVEEQAKFEGGIIKFYQFFIDNFRVPEIETSGVYRVMAGFIVERDGTLSSIKILRSPGQHFDEAVIEVLKKSPKWTPAFQNGETVRSQFTLPITINCDATVSKEGKIRK